MNTWRDVDWLAYTAIQTKRKTYTKSQKPRATPSDTRALIQVPAEGLAPFLMDPSLLPKRPPGRR